MGKLCWLSNPGEADNDPFVKSRLGLILILNILEVIEHKRFVSPQVLPLKTPSMESKHAEALLALKPCSILYHNSLEKQG